MGGLSTKRYPALDVAFSPPQRGGVRFCFTRRDALVASGKFRLIIHANAAGTTGVPLQPLERPACQVRLSEGPACQVRLEGRACRVRCARLGHPSRFTGHDRRAPPNLMHTPPLSASHQLCRDVAQKALAPDLVLLTHFSSPINFPLPSGKAQGQSALSGSSMRNAEGSFFCQTRYYNVANKCHSQCRPKAHFRQDSGGSYQWR
jgi:hypothetical protein